MNELRILLQDNLNIEFISATLSNPRQKEGTVRVKIRPMLKKDKLFFQLESFRNHQAFHQNVGPEEAIELIMEYMENMKQMQMETQQASFSVLISKKGKVTIKSRKNQCERKEIDMSHNRKKRYVLEEGVLVPFLKDLGVMTEEGKVVQSKFDKFRQINRFLEFIDMEHTPKNILIRAVRTGKKGENEAAIRRCEECLHVSPTLGRLLDHKEGE